MKVILEALSVVIGKPLACVLALGFAAHYAGQVIKYLVV